MAVGTTAFPTSLDTVVELVELKNNASSTLSGNVLIGDTTIGVTDIAEFPTTGFGTLSDDLTTPTKTEIISWTGISGSNLTGCTRGAQGTSAAAFSSGNYIEVRPTAGHHEALRGAVIAIETKLGSGTTIAVNKLAALTASKAVVTDASGFISAATVTSTELGYLASVTSPTGSGALVLATSPTLTTPTIAKLANLTSNGFVKTGGGDGTLSVDTSTYLTANQTITLSSDVTGSGTTGITTTIASGAVTYAKMQNISATQRVLGRNTAGAGSTEEVTITQFLDWAGSAAQGDILYRGASAWALLAAGTNGHYLKTQGAGANPVWAAVAGGGGSGDVVGPGSATDNAVVRFDSTTGKLVQDSVVTIADATGNMAGVGTLNTHTIPSGTDTFVLLTANQTLTTKTLTSPDINGGTADSLTSLSVRSTGAAFDLLFANTEVLTGNKTLTIKVNDTSRTVDLGGNLTLAAAFATSGANALTLTTTGATNVTLPTTGTLAIVGGTLAQFAATTSAQLAGVISDETGSGALVFGTSPSIGTPTITGGTHTALTGLGIRSTGTGAFDLTFANTEDLAAGRTLTIKVNDAARTVDLAGNLTLAANFTTSGANALTLTTTGATNVTLPTTGTLAIVGGTLAQFAATTSSQLAGVISDETGSGSLVFGTAPTFASTIAIGTVGGTTGAINFNGTTSGTVTLKVADVAGTYTLTLPANDGDAGQFLQTDGAGVTSWAAGGGGLTIGTTAITSGTAGRILYETSGNVVGEIAGSSADANGAVQWAASARTSGVAQYFRINTPADTGITADTESVGVYFGGNGSGSTVTRTLADGTTFALQRENVFVAPTYAAAGATTITTAATVDISSPIVGANATLTTSAALRLVASAAAHVPLVIQYATSQTGDAFSVFDSTATKRFSFNGNGSLVFNINAATLYNAAGSIAIGASSTHRLVVANSSNGITAHRRGADDTSAQETFRVFREGGTGSGVTGTNGLTWVARSSTTDQEQARLDATWTTVANATRTSTLGVSVVTSATTNVVGTFGNGYALQLVAPVSTAVGLRVDSAATPSANIVEFTNNASNRWVLNSSTTATTATVSDVSGGTQVRGTVTENVTLNTGGTTTDSTIDLPANSIILSVTGRITTTITTATDWKLGDATIADRFSDANATLTAGTTTVGINQWKADRTTAGQGAFQQSTAKVRVTTTGTPGAGVIRITVHYITLTAPTS